MSKPYKSQEEHIFIEHIKKHLFEMDVDDKRPYCKICNKAIDDIIKKETKDKIWLADGLYIPEETYIDRNGKKFRVTEIK